jgi:hypothetical protein
MGRLSASSREFSSNSFGADGVMFEAKFVTHEVETILRTRQPDLLGFDQDVNASFLALA